MLERRSLAVGLLSGGLLISGLFGAPIASAHTCVVDGQTVTLRPFNVGDTHVQICHRTESDSHPFVIINPDLSGACHHLAEHTPDTTTPADSVDIFPDNFLANAATLCA
jgi:hypothetical protein